MPKYLILSDVDGTIMPYGKTCVSERTHQAFVSALEAGHVAGLCTGRAHEQTPPFFNNDERCIASGVFTNGLTIYHEGEVVQSWRISAEEIDALSEAVVKIPRAGLLYFEDGTKPLLYAGTKEDLAVPMKKYADICVESPNLHKAGEKVNTFIAGGAEEAAEMAQALMEAVPTLELDVPQPGFNNIMPKGVNKGSSMLWLANYLDIEPKNIFVFGDADNDLSMLRAIDNGVAVAGATPAAKEAAHWHIGECADDAVAQAIEALTAGGFPFVE